MLEPGQGRGLDFGEGMSIGELSRAAGQDGIAQPEILTKPITAEEAADPKVLEAKKNCWLKPKSSPRTHQKCWRKG
jgi:hypothetical protein